MNLKEINAKLKELGLGYVKISKGEGGRDEVVYKNYESKRYKGLKGGSIGPMTMSTAYLNHNNKVTNILKDTFSYDCGMEDDGSTLTLTFDLDTKLRSFLFTWQLFPSYHPSTDLDDGYQTYWLTMTTKDIKK